MGWFEGLGARLRLLFGRTGAEERMDEEIRFHIEMETDRLVREGVDAREARRRALVAFGGVEKTKEELRADRGLAWMSGLRLDLKLGARLLVKHPLLTTASVLALAVALALAASWFQFMTHLTRPSIALEDADRLVQIRVRDMAAASNRPPTLHDFESWRDDAGTLVEVGAGTPAPYTVTTTDGRIGTVDGMRVTSSLLGLARVRPLLGRTLTPADYEPGEETAVVLGYDVWQRLFDGDRGVVGEGVRLGTTHATVVGVMPPGFGFPVNEEVWTPLRERGLDHRWGEGPPLLVVGRLAPGRTLPEARAELEVIGQRAAASHPVTNEQLRPSIDRFGRGSRMGPAAALLNLPFLFFLVVVATNVATLFFARTASRESEIALRSALGASRRRLVAQLVSESLVLTTLAALIGAAVAHWGMTWGMKLFFEVQQSRPPFWFSHGLSIPTLLYVLLLATVGALIIGGIPAIRATGRRLRHRLSQPGAGGAGMRFGAVATGVIVVQVALCVAFIPVAIMNGQDLLVDRREVAFPAEDFLSFRLVRGTDRDPVVPGDAAGGAVGDDLFDEVLRRLAGEPGVVAATRTSRIPGFNHPVETVEVEADSGRAFGVRTLAVDPGFFDVMGARMVGGRPFRPSDVEGEDGVVIVDRDWALEAFGGRNPIGRRVRYPEREGEEGSRWYEIVGSVAGVQGSVGPGEPVAVFAPLHPDRRESVQVYLRTEERPATLVTRVQEAVEAVDPTLLAVDPLPLLDVWRPVQRANGFFVVVLAVIGAIILLFALIGIYALMSFTVARRSREIGIRAALGADPRRIVVAVFSRALGQIGLGIALGGALVSFTVARDPEGLLLVAGVALAMLVVGLVGCVTPATRALRIQPTDALRAE